MKKKQIREIKTGGLIIYSVVSIVVFVCIQIYIGEFSRFWFANAIISTGFLIRTINKNKISLRKKAIPLVIYFIISFLLSVPFFIYKNSLSMAYLFIFIINAVLGLAFIYKYFLKSNK